MTQKQEFLTVWKDGQEWFDTPSINEQNVMDMLVKEGIMQNCVFLPKGEAPQPIRLFTIQPQSVTNKPKTKTK